MTKSTGKYFCRAGTAQERFDERYIPEPMSGCWVWLAGAQDAGYGSITVNGRRERAHRLSWMLHRGQIPDDKWVLHKCDNPYCVNPDHLFLGTHLENMADMMRKGRHCSKIGRALRPEQAARGERHSQAKLTEVAVREIRSSREPVATLMKKFGISERTLYHAKSGATWRHVQ